MSDMLSTALAAVVIALAVAIAAQLFHSAGIVTTDARNLCVATFLVWCGLAMTIFIFGAFAVLGAWFR